MCVQFREECFRGYQYTCIYQLCCRSEQGNAESDELRLLRDALSLSIPVLNLDPSQLSAQLLSRLMPYITDNETER